MTNYQKLYHYYSNKFTDLIEEMKAIQIEAEELYLQMYETEAVQIDSRGNKKIDDNTECMK